MRCGMIGMFWRDSRSVEFMRPFAGEITVFGDGSFIGQITDPWGEASLEGEFRGRLLCFRKEYIPGKSRGGARGKISYSLDNLGATNKDECQEVCGGFKGFCEVPEEDGRKSRWSATCVVFPLT